MQSRGIKFVKKVVGSTKLKWTLETSILSRQGDILKQHKQILAMILAYIRRNINHVWLPRLLCGQR
jgi:hypothetical protein